MYIHMLLFQALLIVVSHCIILLTLLHLMGSCILLLPQSFRYVVITDVFARVVPFDLYYRPVVLLY